MRSFSTRTIGSAPPAEPRPQDVAAMVRFLCGPAARYITGQAIHAHGGAYLGARCMPSFRFCRDNQA